MAHDTLRPNADVVNNWAKSSGTTSFGALDDAVTDPTNARTGGDGVHLTSSTASQESEVEFGTFTLGSDVVSQVRLKHFATGGAKRGIDVRLLTGTTELVAATRVDANAAEAWRTLTYNGALTQAQIDALRAEFVCVSTAGGGGATAATIYCCYIEVDHAPPVRKPRPFVFGRAAVIRSYRW